jgi:FdhE protein
VGCRRGGVEGQGAGRFLVCGSCGLEWPFERILCPACFERDPVKLPGFTSATHPAVRLEACETCRRYVKSLDLSQDAGPLPEVDDLASLSLDLWAIERGYARVEPGLAGV